MSVLPKKILVVEDNAALAAVIRFNLIRAGFEAVAVPNGERGWEELERGEFGLIITDHQMPRMTGTELCQKVRHEYRDPDLPIFMLTAKSMELDIEKMKQELNLLAVIAKPFSPSAIVKLVESQLSVTN